MLKNELRDILTQHTPQDAPWLDCLNLRQEGRVLHVAFPHAYFAAWFDQHKRTLFEEALNRRFAHGSLPRIVYTCPQWRQGDPGGHRPQVPDTAEAPSTGGKGHSEGKDPFAEFVSNGKNAFPLTTARKIAEQRAGTAYNPFLLCGRSGTGKSHILQAMAAAMARHTAAERIVSATATRFCADVPAWAQSPELFWHRCDILLLDDIQDMVSHRAGQNRLIACMDACPRPTQPDAPPENTARHSAKQMVFACSGPPQALKTLDERLRSRLESGLVVELMEPDIDVRLRYLQIMVKKRGLALAREQLLFLAQRCAQIRLLQGLLLKVEAFCAVKGHNLSQTDLENIVRTGVADKTPGCREILQEVARNMNLRPEDVLGGKRRPDLVLARQLAMYVCRRKLGLSYPELGRAFGGRDHSTVIHAIKKITQLLVSDKRIQRLVTELEGIT